MRRNIVFSGFPIAFCRFIIVVFLVILSFALASGQSPGFTENFNDPDLPGWEYAPNVSVIDGILQIEPGGFAFRGGDWSNFILTIRAKMPSTGGNIGVAYYAGETSSYHLGISGEGLVLLRLENETGIPLANVPIQVPTTSNWIQISITVNGADHSVAIDEEIVLTANDPNPLLPGGIRLEAHETVGEFDDLSIMPSSDSLVPQEATPSDQSNVSGDITWVRTGGPPGGLGYDIRYNFDDPNIWYVTDNYAGVYISTDNGHTWQPSNTGIPSQLGPTGDWRPVFSLTVDPLNPQTIWVGTDVTGHIYKSTDGGATWEQKDNGIVNEWDELTFRGFTVDPRSSDIVYAMAETSIIEFGGHQIWSQGDGGAIYRTTDSGENWTKIWDGGTPSALTRYMWIDPRDPDVLYVSTGIFDRGAINESTDFNNDPDPWGGLGILKSTDGGQTWRVFNEANGLEGLYVGSLYMHPQNPDILLAAVGHEMGFTQINHLREDGPSPAGVYRTTDGGETWTHVLEPPVERVNEEFSAVEYCVNNPDIAYAGSGSAIYRSDDAGITWTQMSLGESSGPPGVRAGWPIDLQCDPRDTNRLFANNYQGGAFLSEDGGSTWINASQGYTGAQMFQIAVDPRDSARVYVVGRSGGWRTDDGGTTWVGLRNFEPGEPHPILAEWGTIAVNPSNPDQIWASDGDGPVIIGSQDRGASWTVHVPPEGVQGSVVSYAFSSTDPNTIYAGYGDLGCHRSDAPCAPIGGIIVSHDNGQTWQISADETLLSTTIGDLAIDPDYMQVIYAAATDSGLFKTTDGGASWTQVDLSALENPTVTDPDMLMAPLRVQTVALDPANSQHLLIGVQLLGIFSSTDGGDTWQPAYAGLEPNSAIHDIVFDPTDSQIVYTSDRTSGVYRSSDGGQTWIRINDGLNNRAAMWLAISADGQHIYVSTDGEGVYRLDMN